MLRLGLVLTGKAETRVFQPVLGDSVGVGVLLAAEGVHQPLHAHILADGGHVGPGELAEIVEGDGFEQRGLQVSQFAAKILKDPRLGYSADFEACAFSAPIFSLIIWRACFSRAGLFASPGGIFWTNDRCWRQLCNVSQGLGSSIRPANCGFTVIEEFSSQPIRRRVNHIIETRDGSSIVRRVGCEVDYGGAVKHHQPGVAVELRGLSWGDVLVVDLVLQE
ncbi:unknown [Sinorhizobium phage PBC5]|nr:unknown [Sinorhizobium phage PBC5]